MSIPHHTDAENLCRRLYALLARRVHVDSYIGRVAMPESTNVWIFVRRGYVWIWSSNLSRDQTIIESYVRRRGAVCAAWTFIQPEAVDKGKKGSGGAIGLIAEVR